ncbi:helix-turn-helix domain-containing protein [Thalassobacillus pellis]|uniref:helix-turn-helix domain-containing protein n=1 Tax=Thalassobacillus pellis TaxID=748008 RepID=UPI00195FF550|nr:helix-turn-helix transcriptional regulator [Thalassobacillus pellis]MBM7555153.1 transcriptional regulator with XRE-family HTH domain [Thalassobacillus pellis]
MADKQWGRRIKGFRKLKGMTQVEFSRKLDISVSILGEIERGSREPDQATLKLIAKTLGVSLDELTSTPKKKNKQGEDLYV